MELFCYQAECGDAIRLRYIDSDGRAYNIFLDSGYERTYRQILRQEIQDITQAKESIDLWVISHIHDDHIGGVMKYIKAVEEKDIEDITKVWFYNSPRQYSFSSKERDNGISQAMSIGQGDRLYKFLKRNDKLLKEDVTTDLETQFLGKLKIHILSPTPSVIEELRGKYTNKTPIQNNEADEVSFASAVSESDYNKPIEEFQLNDFNEDKSIENKSSISILIEYQNKKILWLSDSHPSIVGESLVQKGYSIKQPVVCDCVILSHHASKGNNNSALFDIIRCNKYIISSNGDNKYSLPNKEVLARLLLNKNRDFSVLYSLYFTYAGETLKNIFKIDGDKVRDRWNFKTIYSEDKFLHFKL